MYALRSSVGRSQASSLPVSETPIHHHGLYLCNEWLVVIEHLKVKDWKSRGKYTSYDI